MRSAPSAHPAVEPPALATTDSIDERLGQLAVREGDVVLGKYRLVGLLAASATGAVFLAHHTELDHEVAVKLLLEPFAHDPEVRARFSREARLMGRIDSDHVARVIDVGELADGTPLIAMESLRGVDLRQVVRDNPAGIEPAGAVDLIIQSCLGLAAAHARDIIHRDIKPSNLFLAEREDGTAAIKVIDFGVAKMRAGSASLCDALTSPSSLVGSPRYMAPEQVTSARDVDARSDIWALGAILQELITGQAAFPDSGVSNVLRRIVSGSPARLLELAPSVDAGLAGAVSRALSRDRRERPGDVAEFARELAPFATPAGRALVARVARVLAQRTASRPNADASERSASASGSRARAAPVVVLPPRGLDDDNVETRPLSSRRTGDSAPVAILGPIAPVSIRAPVSVRAQRPLGQNATIALVGGGVLFIAVAVGVVAALSRSTVPAAKASSGAPLAHPAPPPPR
ncbi:MAG: serine/threonine protein kinase [Myxococcales bacterium]|nr:serine/threonine protein kinase [Myxococcales bacterium]